MHPGDSKTAAPQGKAGFIVLKQCLFPAEARCPARTSPPQRRLPPRRPPHRRRQRRCRAWCSSWVTSDLISPTRCVRSARTGAREWPRSPLGHWLCALPAPPIVTANGPTHPQRIAGTTSSEPPVGSSTTLPLVREHVSFVFHCLSLVAHRLSLSFHCLSAPKTRHRPRQPPRCRRRRRRRWQRQPRW